MNFTDLNIEPIIRFGKDRPNKPIQLYRNYLPFSKELKIKLGYFSTNAIFPLSIAMASFIANDGKMTFITNHFLRKKDRDLLIDTEVEDLLIKSIINDEEQLAELIQNGSDHFFSCLKYLKKEGRLIIQPVKTIDNEMSHYKDGVLIDEENNRIAFSGTCNFTYKGLVDNGESLTAFYSWLNKESNDLANEELEIINQIVDGSNTEYRLIEADEILEIINNAQGKDQNELIQDEKELITRFKNFDASRYYLNYVRDDYEFSNYSDKIDKEPKFPFEKPFDYQVEAYENWRQNNYKGLFAMATGTGKTITALNCVLEEYKKNGFYRFIVVVPTNPLAHQWNAEISDKFNYKNVINSCIHKDWEKQLKRNLISIKAGNEINFAFITTYAQLQRSKLKRLFHQFENEFKEVTFISDEAHTLGSPGGLKNLPTLFEKRIGLSATPERKYDHYGSKKLEQFFDAYPPRYTFYYSMKEAIENDSLSEFEYHPIFVNLEYDEIKQYNEFTNRLRPYIDSKSGGYKDSPEAKRLLIQRKHVIHKAQNKLSAIGDIIDSVGKINFKYAFVYVPEGYEPDYWQEEESIISKEDERIINHYSRMLDRKGLLIHQFLGGTKNRNSIIKNFEKGKYDALLAMKCLDEGVDIPRTEYAIFCASTGNPRQFIQRRGRVLRTHTEKNFAKIYDLIVSPDIDSLDVVDDAQRDVEKKIFRNELQRVINFLALASNRLELVDGEFGKKCEEFGIVNLKELIMEELNNYQIEE